MNQAYGNRLLKQLLLQGKPIFTQEEVCLAANVETIPDNQLNKILSNLNKQQRIIRLRRGLYLYNDALLNRAQPHPFIISSRLVEPSVISHWSALAHHGLTEQIPQAITASTYKKIVTPSMRNAQLKKQSYKHAWEINNIRYEYIQITQQHFFGLQKIWIDEYSQILITDKERTLLDVFIYLKMFGGMGEALGILENVLTTLDIEKLIAYAVQYQQKSLAKRIGWALESMGVSETLLEPLFNIPLNHYCRLDPNAPAAGSCDKRWMIQNNLGK